MSLIQTSCLNQTPIPHSNTRFNVTKRFVVHYAGKAVQRASPRASCRCQQPLAAPLHGAARCQYCSKWSRHPGAAASCSYSSSHSSSGW